MFIGAFLGAQYGATKVNPGDGAFAIPGYAILGGAAGGAIGTMVGIGAGIKTTTALLPAAEAYKLGAEAILNSEACKSAADHLLLNFTPDQIKACKTALENMANQVVTKPILQKASDMLKEITPAQLATLGIIAFAAYHGAANVNSNDLQKIEKHLGKNGENLTSTAKEAGQNLANVKAPMLDKLHQAAEAIHRIVSAKTINVLTALTDEIIIGKNQRGSSI
jgi:hypothetical protein